MESESFINNNDELVASVFSVFDIQLIPKNLALTGIEVEPTKRSFRLKLIDSLFNNEDMDKLHSLTGR